jgi:dienelactone hydrolase
MHGYLARPDTAERLPAVLLIPGSEGATAWAQESARDLASVGYVTLTVEPYVLGGPSSGSGPPRVGDEQTLTKLWAALRWLRGRDDVLSQRVGVLGWSWGAGQALALAATIPVQACVVCDGPVSADPVLLAGLHDTPVLGLFPRRPDSSGDALPAFRQALAAKHIPHKIVVYEDARSGFLGPPDQRGFYRETADKAWVEIYEYLGKYVEDAPVNPVSATPSSSRAVASIDDLMRSVNDATGVRGTLMRDLEQDPGTMALWLRVRANAALMSEVGNLLLQRTPPRGPVEHWHGEARSYAGAAERLAAAAERHDYAAARRALDELGATCASCHRQHR